MIKVGPTEAAETLRDYFGDRLEANRNDGRDQMVSALMERFQMSKDDAKKLVDDLIAADSIRFYPSSTGAGTAEAVVTGGSGSGSAAPAIAGIGGGGYWQFK